MMGITRFAPAFLALVLVAPALRAQGTLSTQGLGFPPGQLSAPSRVMGGSTGEADALSPLNPAAISMLTTAVVSLQSEPEYRRLETGGAAQTSSVARFPLFFGALPMGSRYTVAASASTLLDRTWRTTQRDSQFIGSDTLASSMTRRSDGSITDVRLALAYATTRWLRLGVAGHVYSGRTLLEALRNFDDTTRFAADTFQTSIGFAGAAVSIGAQAFWPRLAAVGVSYRRGGSLKSYQGDEVVDVASAPGHLGISAVYLGITGTQLAVRLAKDDWSPMRQLGDSLKIHEGLDVGIGADVRGPMFAGSPVSMRAGARWRTLPFSATESPVREQSYSAGVGLPMARNRVELNLGGILSLRSFDGGGDISERAWTFSTGFLIRP